jgi:hypothetical protein
MLNIAVLITGIISLVTTSLRVLMLAHFLSSDRESSEKGQLPGATKNET